MSPKTTSTCTLAVDPSSFSRAFGSLLETSLTTDSWSARNSRHSSTNLPRRKTRTKAGRRRRRKRKKKLKMTSSPCNGRPTSSASHPADAHSHSALTPPRSKKKRALSREVPLVVPQGSALGPLRFSKTNCQRKSCVFNAIYVLSKSISCVRKIQ